MAPNGAVGRQVGRASTNKTSQSVLVLAAVGSLPEQLQAHLGIDPGDFTTAQSCASKVARMLPPHELEGLLALRDESFTSFTVAARLVLAQRFSVPQLLELDFGALDKIVQGLPEQKQLALMEQAIEKAVAGNQARRKAEAAAPVPVNGAVRAPAPVALGGTPPGSLNGSRGEGERVRSQAGSTETNGTTVGANGLDEEPSAARFGSPVDGSASRPKGRGERERRDAPTLSVDHAQLATANGHLAHPSGAVSPAGATSGPRVAPGNFRHSLEDLSDIEGPVREALVRMIDESRRDVQRVRDLPQSILRRATDMDMLQRLAKWSNGLPRVVLKAVAAWLDGEGAHVPLGPLLSVPPDVLAAATSPGAVEAVMKPLLGIPASLLAAIRTQEQADVLRQMCLVAPQTLHALEHWLASADQATQIALLAEICALPRPLLFRVATPQDAYFLCNWSRGSRASMDATAALLQLPQYNPHVSALQKLPQGSLFACKSKEEVGWLLDIQSNHRTLRVLPVIDRLLHSKKIKLEDACKVPLKLVEAVSGPDQVEVLARIGPALSEIYIPIERLSPEQTWKKLSAGEFGAVYEAEYAGSAVVCKVPFKVDDWLDLTMHEIATMTKVPPHPCVISFYGVSAKMHRGEVELIMVMNYEPGGNATQFLNPVMIPVKWADRFLLCLNVAEALHHLHAQHPPVVHRDLKPENILLRERPQRFQRGGRYLGILTDFGLARFRKDTRIVTKVGGTDRYMAPECFEADARTPGKGVDEKSDVFSFAMVCWAILTGATPFERLLDLDPNAAWVMIYKLVCEQKKRPDEYAKWPKPVPPEMVALLRKCWAHEKADRPSFSTIAGDFLEICRHYHLCDANADVGRSIAHGGGNRRSSIGHR